MQRIGQHEQARQRLIRLAGEFLADTLHGFDRGQVDVDHDAGKITCRMIGQIEDRNRFHAAGVLQNMREFAVLVLDIGGEQQTSRVLSFFGQRGHSWAFCARY